jgi:hypothetical protein
MPPTSNGRAAPTAPTAKQLLLQHLYDGDLDADIEFMSGLGVSWREMAKRVGRSTEHKVSYESLRKWYQKDATKADPEANREKSRRWHEANPEKAREKNRSWTKANRDAINERVRASRAARKAAALAEAT